MRDPLCIAAGTCEFAPKVHHPPGGKKPYIDFAIRMDSNHYDGKTFPGKLIFVHVYGQGAPDLADKFGEGDTVIVSGGAQAEARKAKDSDKHYGNLVIITSAQNVTYMPRSDRTEPADTFDDVPEDPFANPKPTATAKSPTKSVDEEGYAGVPF